MHFWAGVSALAGAMRRRVWIDMKRFTWTPSFYIIFVAPPGIVSKSTTADIGMDLLREVPGVKFGPHHATMPALVSAWAAASEAFEFDQSFHPMSALTLVASELGTLLNLQDKDMVNLLIELWDGKKHFEKITKTSGNDVIHAPWINLIGCTTPHWVADNVPPSMIGGGLSSRCVFIYAEEKEKYVPYVDEVVSDQDATLRAALIHDLEHIAVHMVGPFVITAEARAWGRDWYVDFWKKARERMDDQMLEGYAARKQTPLHKLAMVLSASRSDARVITEEDLQVANLMLLEVEEDMHKVFSRIGRSEESLKSEQILAFISKSERVPFEEVYRYIHAYFPKAQDFEQVLAGLVKSGQVEMKMEQSGVWLKRREV
jgi:hypothetical protein